MYFFPFIFSMMKFQYCSFKKERKKKAIPMILG